MLIFIGFFCSGKTTQGIKLAKEKNLPFIDTDDLIEQRYKMPIWAVFQTLGEKHFREIEHEILSSIPKQDAVLATGGGTPLTEKNQILLKQMGKLTYLKTPFETLYSRILDRRLPSFIDEKNPYASCKKIFDQRDIIYTKIADIIQEINT